MNIQDIAIQELKRLTSNPKFVQHFADGINNLTSSGVFDFLRKFSRPYVINGEVSKDAAQANFCAGYHQALDDLYYFNDMYGGAINKATDVVPTFGALAIALDKGDITKEEVLKLRGEKNGR